MKIASRSVPTSLDVPKKVETLAIAKDYRYTSEDIQKMLQEKKDVCTSPDLFLLVLLFLINSIRLEHCPSS